MYFHFCYILDTKYRLVMCEYGSANFMKNEIKQTVKYT